MTDHDKKILGGAVIFSPSPRPPSHWEGEENKRVGI